MIEIYNMGENGGEFSPKDIGDSVMPESIGQQIAAKLERDAARAERAASESKPTRRGMQPPETWHGSPNQGTENSVHPEVAKNQTTGLEPAPEPGGGAKKLADELVGDPDHAATRAQKIDPESAEGRQVDEEANALRAQIAEELSKPEEEQDKHFIYQAADKLAQLLSGNEAPESTHTDEDDAATNNENTVDGQDSKKNDGPFEAPVDDKERKASPAPREDDAEINTAKKEMEDAMQKLKTGELSQEEAEARMRNTLAGILEKYEAANKKINIVLFWTLIALTISYILAMKTIGGAVARAGKK